MVTANSIVGNSAVHGGGGGGRGMGNSYQVMIMTHYGGMVII